MKTSIHIYNQGKEDELIQTESNTLRTIGTGIKGHVTIINEAMCIMILNPEGIGRIIKRNDGSDDLCIGVVPKEDDIIIWEAK